MALTARRAVSRQISPRNRNVNFSADRAFARLVQRHVHRAIKVRDPDTRNRGVKHNNFGVLRDDRLGNTPARHPCRACLLEIEFLDVEAVDHLLNTGPDYCAVRDEIAVAIKDAIIEELET